MLLLINKATSNGFFDSSQVDSIKEAILWSSLMSIITLALGVAACLTNGWEISLAANYIIAVVLCMGILTYSIVVSLTGAGLPMIASRELCVVIMAMAGLLTAAIVMNIIKIHYEWRIVIATIGLGLEVQVLLSLVYDFIIYICQFEFMIKILERIERIRK